MSSKLMGKQERVLTLDGEYIHMDSVEAKKFFERGKSAVSYNFSDIISCVNSKKTSATFRLTVNRQDGTKIYDFEASSPHVASKSPLLTQMKYALDLRISWK
jgi:SAPK-interacting protein 1 (Sin1), Pleckstrin-homology